MTDLPLTSEALYFGLNIGLGSIEIVKMRRDLVQLRDIIENRIRNDGDRAMISGSTREGYRLASSDFDLMQWPVNHKLISILSQAERYQSTKNTLILMESERCPPGFVLLRLLNDTDQYRVHRACIEENNALYISSSKYREVMFLKYGNPEDESHGPCTSGTVEVTNEQYDHACCFMSDIWPAQALSWIERCTSNLWPSMATLSKIVNSGCHAVAIGHKLSSYEDVEWRISFSLAEHILMFSLNHCQFLCYGLLKLFLNEVINKSNAQERVLCSYHLKTTLLWVVQENIVQNWCPKNLIKCFWICFQTIINYVYHGVCPNFFIPENNMFLGKVEGDV
ncbi:uncharacterized protein LOC134241177 [Saccostrea cucullata]|uniref:uncharacterized protein LOC134241177 n=1 Tax=Saccostrea cuccullata TaxID=36930 RepID=UPI002ED6B296